MISSSAPPPPSSSSIKVTKYFNLAGVFARKAAAANVKVGDAVHVEFEPTNPYDTAAMVAKHNGNIIGYIPRYLQREASPLVNQGRSFVVISSGEQHVLISSN